MGIITLGAGHVVVIHHPGVPVSEINGKPTIKLFDLHNNKKNSSLGQQRPDWVTIGGMCELLSGPETWSSFTEKRLSLWGRMNPAKQPQVDAINLPQAFLRESADISWGAGEREIPRPPGLIRSSPCSASLWGPAVVMKITTPISSCRKHNCSTAPASVHWVHGSLDSPHILYQPMK